MNPSKAAVPNQRYSKRRRHSATSLDDERGRSRSEGSRRKPKLQNTSRQSSSGSSVMSLDVRCACQYFQSSSLLPDRLNPVGMRPSSRNSNLIVRFRYVIRFNFYCFFFHISYHFSINFVPFVSPGKRQENKG